MPLRDQKIGFLGGGAMAEALIAGLLRSGLVEPASVYASDISAARQEYLEQKFGIKTADNSSVVSAADIVVLAVKPQAISGLLEEIAPAARPELTVVSVVAGISTDFIEGFFKTPVPVVRVMPNTPCLVGEGASALSPGKFCSQPNMDKALAILKASGQAVVVDESMMDCVTGLSGSAPAYMYLIMEGFIDGAVRLGLSRDVARVLTAQTMLGSAKMVLETGEHPAKLKDMVTTPGGTTIAGLYALEEGALRSVLMKAVAEAALRSSQLAPGKNSKT
ncbi:Pyrroline-5-carboxylate reductase [Pelotomaculum schinkii]|uniref:Pyrroline-5-carboxylate reductase n=1 Tax=Pelotomaculum schinkii TaxID=78350 RepID=A0A4Y7RAH6_9FIRM|nr:pyrroline-5-carboxylate reductase [Pelotomaculum schinkii]TEB05802.1 Pyrroline-5-carboxylate reductase [Pelotomaculum schinkii]